MSLLVKVLLFISGLLVGILAGPQFKSEDDKPEVTLYIKNNYDEKERIADFYQSHQAMEDCQALAQSNWSIRTTSCQIN